MKSITSCLQSFIASLISKLVTVDIASLCPQRDRDLTFDSTFDATGTFSQILTFFFSLLSMFVISFPKKRLLFQLKGFSQAKRPSCRYEILLEGSIDFEVVMDYNVMKFKCKQNVISENSVNHKIKRYLNESGFKFVLYLSFQIKIHIIHTNTVYQAKRFLFGSISRNGHSFLAASSRSSFLTGFFVGVVITPERIFFNFIAVRASQAFKFYLYSRDFSSFQWERIVYFSEFQFSWWPWSNVKGLILMQSSYWWLSLLPFLFFRIELVDYSKFSFVFSSSNQRTLKGLTGSNFSVYQVIFTIWLKFSNNSQASISAIDNLDFIYSDWGMFGLYAVLMLLWEPALVFFVGVYTEYPPISLLFSSEG